ncbi:retinitis pigmentosa 1-like 1 protein [Betta splendens]|uniref:Retinitis pigmentosa 1-like 1 protein n=1 Tax=Betta splendens TaxID=158456 RepID=A0A6P7KTI3_BETSP|nr:retinitis pigmentosa 1-like 1 protein [Betta splendens]
MDYCVLNGFLVAILIQHCTSEGLSTSNQSLSVVSFKDVRAPPHEPDVPHVDVVPVVAPPSLKEVQQVMQEASERVEGHAAEEVLKELLEKVEAAMGQVEGGGEGKGDEAAVQKAVTEDALGADKGDSDTKDVLEQEAEEEVVEGKDMGPEGGDTAAGKEQVVAEVDAFKDIAEEEERVVKKKKGLTAAGSVEETAAAGGTGDRVEVINKSLDTGVSQEEKGATSKEAGGDLTAQEAKVADDHEQVGRSKAEGPAETGTLKAEPTLRVVTMALGDEQENAGASDPGLAGAGAEQPGDAGGEDGALAEEAPADENEGEIETSPSDSNDMEVPNTVAEEEGGDPATGPSTEGKPEGGAVDEGADVSVETGGGRDGVSEVSEVSESAADKEGEPPAGGDHPEPSRGSGTEHREVLPPPDFDAAASEEQGPAPGPRPSPALGGKSPEDEQSKLANEIVTSTDDLLKSDAAAAAAAAQPTLDNVVTDVLAPGARPERNEAGWTNELVEGAAGAAEPAEPGLEAWKIGAIAAAVFLLVETFIILVYIVKRRSRSSAPARQRASEDGRVEPEEATGGDCSDDTLPADSEQAALDPPDVASTLAHSDAGQHQEGDATAMSGLPSGPAAQPELRTSML